MPFYVAVYDVSTDRVGKVHRLFKRYLTWVQNSVFEGNLSPARFAELEVAALAIMEETDSLLVYEWRTRRYFERKTYGAEKGSISRFV